MLVSLLLKVLPFPMFSYNYNKQYKESYHPLLFLLDNKQPEEGKGKEGEGAKGRRGEGEN